MLNLTFTLRTSPLFLGLKLDDEDGPTVNF